VCLLAICAFSVLGLARDPAPRSVTAKAGAEAAEEAEEETAEAEAEAEA